MLNYKTTSVYILKTDTSNTVTEYLQLRDDDFALVEYIKLSLLEKVAGQWIKKYNLQTSEKEIIENIKNAPYNQIVKI